MATQFSWWPVQHQFVSALSFQFCWQLTVVLSLSKYHWCQYYCNKPNSCPSFVDANFTPFEWHPGRLYSVHPAGWTKEPAHTWWGNTGGHCQSRFNHCSRDCHLRTVIKCELITYYVHNTNPPNRYAALVLHSVYKILNK